jgi:hypothetical protein
MKKKLPEMLGMAFGIFIFIVAPLCYALFIDEPYEDRLAREKKERIERIEEEWSSGRRLEQHKEALKLLWECKKEVQLISRMFPYGSNRETFDELCGGVQLVVDSYRR